MKTYPLDEVLDNVIGKQGTPRRDELEAAVQASLVGDAIRQARKEKKMTQEQLGKILGVGRSQISRIESGQNLTIQTLVRVFRALGTTANINVGESSVSLV